ncbi:MAG: hypothetical protein U5K79_15910 [Cyclobacteriaceae bacterium]|nr:hypothetical protein [Cyclobacteriaceae bacterium]
MKSILKAVKVLAIFIVVLIAGIALYAQLAYERKFEALSQNRKDSVAVMPEENISRLGGRIVPIATSGEGQSKRLAGEEVPKRRATFGCQYVIYIRQISHRIQKPVLEI